MSTEAAPIFSQDPWIYRVVVCVLGLAVLLVVGGGIVLAIVAKNDIMPQGILAIGSAAAGGLVGLLVPSPVSRKP